MTTPSEEPLISIVGGGLSAIYAYFAALESGYAPKEIEILRSQFSNHGGAVFMYECPISFPTVPIHSLLLGTCAGYAERQWGDPTIKTSVNRRFIEGRIDNNVEYLWDPNEVLPILWGMIPRIIPVGQLEDSDIEELRSRRKAVICTFAPVKVRQSYIDSQILSFFPTFQMPFTCSSYVVTYNGLKEVPWVRQSQFPGRMFVEYPRDTVVPKIIKYEETRGNKDGTVKFTPDIARNGEILSTEDRIDGNLLRIGRFSAFDPDYLSHFCSIEVKYFLENL